jgi:hypothetical protein
MAPRVIRVRGPDQPTQREPPRTADDAEEQARPPNGGRRYPLALLASSSVSALFRSAERSATRTTRSRRRLPLRLCVPSALRGEIPT